MVKKKVHKCVCRMLLLNNHSILERRLLNISHSTINLHINVYLIFELIYQNCTTLYNGKRDMENIPFKGGSYFHCSRESIVFDIFHSKSFHYSTTAKIVVLCLV